MKTTRQVSAPGGQIIACAPAGELVPKKEENPQLLSVKEAAQVSVAHDDPFAIDALGDLESEWPPDLLDLLGAAIEAAQVSVAHDDPFAINALGPELFAEMYAAEKDFTNKLSSPELIAAIDADFNNLRAPLSRKTNGVLDYPDGNEWL